MASISNPRSGMNTKTHNRIEIWRQEVADATSSQAQPGYSSDRSLAHRASFWSRILKPKSGKGVPEEGDRTEMYDQIEDDNVRKDGGNDDGDESLLFRSESTEPDALRKRRDRLERAARLIMASNAANEKIDSPMLDIRRSTERLDKAIRYDNGSGNEEYLDQRKHTKCTVKTCMGNREI
ncbi:hypothetical protein B7463_g1148, partial [Scytalidium lignicola]